MHSTNYHDVFIEVAEDSTADRGIEPPERKSGKTVANLEYDIISQNPYKYTSDDVKFDVHSIRNKISESASKKAKEEYFSKGQPCFRASPLTKSYGWGVHNNPEGRIAIFSVDSKEYKQFLKNKSIGKIKAMRSKRK